MNPERTVDTRTLVIFAVIALVLLGLVALGVAWAKNRANQLATQGSQSEQSQPATNSQEEQQPAGPANNVAGNQTASPTTNTGQGSGSHTVPAAGMADLGLLVGSVSVAAFAGVRYWQARQKLLSFR